MTSLTLSDLETMLLICATAGYITAWVVYLLALNETRRSLGWVASRITLASLILHAGAFATRSHLAGHLPIYNGFEFTSTFAGGVIFLHLVFERMSQRRELGVCTLPVALLILAFAYTYTGDIEPLLPIFRGTWLKVHIFTAFVAYAAFAVTFAGSCGYLFAERQKRGPFSPPALDRVAYRAATVGFSFLTVCIVTGAVWAEFVWGHFWSWDPKETWSLITWFIFAAYLHMRYGRGWAGRPAAVLGILGFIFVLVTYVGVDFVTPRGHGFLMWRGK